LIFPELALTQSGYLIAAGGLLRVWKIAKSDLSDIQLVLSVDPGDVPPQADFPGEVVEDFTGFQFSANGRWLGIAVPGSDGCWAAIWDLEPLDTANAKAEPEYISVPKGTAAFAISSDRRWLACTRDLERPIVLDLIKGSAVQRAIELPEEKAEHFVFSLDNRSLCGVGSSGAFVWRVSEFEGPSLDWHSFEVTESPQASHQRASYRLDQSFKLAEDAATDAAFSSDGRWLAIATLAGVQLQEVDNYVGQRYVDGEPTDRGRLADEQVEPLDESAGDAAGYDKTLLPTRGEPIRVVRFSYDGRWLVGGGVKGSVYLWDLTSDARSTTGTIVVREEGRIKSCFLSADSEWVASHSGRWGPVKLTRRSLADLVAEAQRRVGRNFTGGEWEQYFPGQPYSRTFEDLPALDFVE
jgi:WD40 repeat protein